MNQPNHESPELTNSSAGLGHDLRGILLPFTTPFKSNEDLDAEGLRNNLRKWNASGIVGYVALGSTGERVHLAESEYARVIEIARQEIPENLALLVGAGQQSSRGTIEEIKRAASLGADGVLVITPSFYRPAISAEALIDHYRTVADASPVPIILYSMPDLTGIKIEPETVAQLSTHPNIVGIKDSSADISGFRQTVRLVSDEFAVLTGNGTVLCDALGAGARGGILAVGCVASAVCIEIYRLVRVGETQSAASLQQKLTPLALAVTKRYGIGGLKAALEMIGFAGGNVRAPLKLASVEARHDITALLEVIKHINISTIDINGEREEFAGVIKP